MEETIQLLKDTSISTREKIDWLEDQIMDAEEQRIELKKKFEQHDFYGPRTPNQSDVEMYGDYAKDALAAEWEDERRFLKRQLTNKENQLDTFRLKLKKYQRVLQENEGSEKQVGRPRLFKKSDTKKWHLELKEKEEFQHKNGKPHKTKIREEIIRRHSRIEENGQEVKPSMKTIKNHYKDLGL